ncbi:RAC family serine/threonine-protein kinase homolog [Durusdinium trenchii]|uniref:RAC family serine/threonine-protein kinase homolog n=1 Tax=Durusdinium trenchii TaxID=1381693 RepID=A0ABP0KKW4_9DINO
MMANKRPLPASLTFSGASPLKKDNFVQEFLDENDPKCGQEQTAASSSPLTTSGGRHAKTSSVDLDVKGMSKLLASSSSHVRGTHRSRKVADEDFERIMTLGTGSFAKVVLVRSQVKADDGKLYAMKVLDKQRIIQQKQTAHTMTERSVLGQTSSHPFIVSLKYAYQTSATLNLVMDFCSGGELYYHLSRIHRFPEHRAKFYAAELSLALEHLHMYNVVYRDLKPENVLIASDGHIMLADFGLSKQGIRKPNKGTDTFCGTPEYLAPEVLHRSGHGTAVDWWSLGILVFEMLTGLPPWYSKNRQRMFEGICSHELTFPEDIPLSHDTRNLISELLVKQPHQRLGARSVDDVKHHRYFRDTNFELLLAKALPVPWKPEPGKIYFDTEYTQLSFETAGSRATKPADSTSSAHHAILATSPLYPSTLVEQAFSGFSYTDPSSAAFAASVSPSPRSLSNRECETMMDTREDDCDDAGTGAASVKPFEGAAGAVEEKHHDMLPFGEEDCFGQFPLEFEES